MKRVILTLLLMVIGPLAAAAQLSQVPIRSLIVDWYRQYPTLAFTANDLVDGSIRQRLKSGLPQTFVTRIYAFREHQERDPVAVSMFSCRVVYDLWEEVYRVRLQNVQRSQDRLAPSVDAVARLCLNPSGVTVGSEADFARLRGKGVYFGVIIEFNPMSDGTVERIRRWIARSGGSGKLTGDAFFGSFVSIFVDRKMGSAERTFRFRSPPMWVP